MSFLQDLLLMIIDKIFITVGLIIIGYLINRRLERDKTNEDIRKQVAGERANAYLDLWQLTAKIDDLGSKPLTVEKAKPILQEVTNWYYEEGNGIYLSHRATILFLTARKLLKGPSPDIAEVKRVFSELRTQMKQDIGVYSEKEAQKSVTKATGRKGSADS